MDGPALAGALADRGIPSARANRDVITRGALTRIADTDGVDARTVERDYVLTHVIAAIGPRNEGPKMIFKGGTALRLCHFRDYRYSADLDFSLTEGTSVADATAAVAGALADTAARVGFGRLALSAESTAVQYLGPLGREHEVKLDLADDEHVEETTTLELHERYADQSPATVDVYTLREIAAEKLRCVIQRSQARDLFDLNELLVIHKIDADEVWPTFERKARHKNYDPGLFAERFETRMEHWKGTWDAEMTEHLPGDPEPFRTVERRVRRALRGHLGED